MRSGGDVKSFFRQQKAHSGAAAATKPAGGVSKKAAHHHQKQAAAAAHLLRPIRAAADHRDGADAARREEEEDAERTAREFDMDTRYGPCLGLTRAQRWQRAAALGLAPPPHAPCSDHQPCLWEGRV
ncbi:uncharacterized protein LOC125534172 [Triticum urartu]|uniref:uncharacterized protein LOC125534172 n=1 Tax=Triticum urartu TaxID=4572 RepID=UPI001E1FE38A|nr:uncharacterized protein LOC125534172 [Triticum urartu]